MRRALEYTIHDRELQDTKKKLSEMENKRKNSGEEAERLRNALQDAQDAAKAASKDVKDEVSGDNKSKDRAEQELTKLKDTIAVKEKDLEKIKPAYEEMKKKEEECTRELNLKEQKRKELYAKQGRGS